MQYETTYILYRMNLYFFILMQRYSEKPLIPNIPFDFSSTTCDTPRILRQNPKMTLISVADDDYFVLFPKIFGSFDNYSYLCNQL